MFNRFSTYSRPINVCLSQGFQLSPQYLIFRKRSIRVLIYNGLGNLTNILQKLSVTGYIRYFYLPEKEVILQVSAEKLPAIQTEFINGKKCIVIPLEEDEHATINGKHWNNAPF